MFIFQRDNFGKLGKIPTSEVLHTVEAKHLQLPFQDMATAQNRLTTT